MKAAAALVLLALVVVAPASAADTNPVQKVIEMLSGLQAKIIKEGEEASKLFDEFNEWCEDTSKDLGFEIKTGKAEAADLQSTIDKEAAAAAELTSKIEGFAAAVANA